MLWPFLLTVMWALGLAAVLGPLAVRGYRAAAESHTDTLPSADPRRRVCLLRPCFTPMAKVS